MPFPYIIHNYIRYVKFIPLIFTLTVKLKNFLENI